MTPQTGTALILLVAFVLPGFVTVLIKERIHVTAQDRSQLDRLLQVVYYSVWSYLLLALVALAFEIDRGSVESLYDRNRDDPAPLVLLAAIAIVVPSVAIAGVGLWWDRSRLRRWLQEQLNLNIHHQTPTAWDHFFLQGKPAMVRATLRDGRVLGGYYGSESFAAYAKDARDLYLEQRWVMNDQTNWFQEPANDTLGIWLPTEDVVKLELYTPNQDDR